MGLLAAPIILYLIASLAAKGLYLLLANTRSHISDFRNWPLISVGAVAGVVYYSRQIRRVYIGIVLHSPTVCIDGSNVFLDGRQILSAEDAGSVKFQVSKRNYLDDTLLIFPDGRDVVSIDCVLLGVKSAKLSTIIDNYLRGCRSPHNPMAQEQ